MKVREVIRLVENDGWELRGYRGSHRQCEHPQKPGPVTIPGKPGKDLHPKTLASILEQAGLRP